MITHRRHRLDPHVTDAFRADFDELAEIARKHQTRIDARLAAVLPGSLARLST